LTLLLFERDRGKHLGGALQQLQPPMPDLVRVNVLLLRQPDQGLVTFERRQRHLRFESC